MVEYLNGEGAVMNDQGVTRFQDCDMYTKTTEVPKDVKDYFIPILAVLEANFKCVGVCDVAKYNAFSFSDVNK